MGIHRQLRLGRLIPSDLAGLQASEFKSKFLNSLPSILLPQEDALLGRCTVLKNQLDVVRAKTALGAATAGVVAERVLGRWHAFLYTLTPPPVNS